MYANKCLPTNEVRPFPSQDNPVSVVDEVVTWGLTVPSPSRRFRGWTDVPVSLGRYYPNRSHPIPLSPLHTPLGVIEEHLPSVTTVDDPTGQEG